MWVVDGGLVYRRGSDDGDEACNLIIRKAEREDQLMFR